MVEKNGGKLLIASQEAMRQSALVYRPGTGGSESK